ncbi:helix-turn-helix transcriptional regulator [Reyranella sp. CPCC 100927]|uniref:ArsR/SmtB family transcription factor n=1 Tax=Reyranella sp. CPCC 100927 TaxID=2599616 RepID=UPI0011B780FF|nr:metalloregulator ArsR/SmtB family transcription factor [Reyranella sp. CPCC 100927]TWT10620.1 helix-turn-helix transcriptional regulator [Reyranella sp. CPCC 100927]
MIQTHDSLNTLFQALADPYRRGMVDQLARGPASVKELARAHDMAMPSAVKHLKVLESAGLVTSQKAGRVRTFAVRAQALQSIDDWLAGHKRALNAAFDRLQQLMEDEQRAGKP